MAPRLKSKRILPPCTQCGACCVSTDDTHYHAELNDAEGMRGRFGPGGRYRRYAVRTGYGDDQRGLATRWRTTTAGPLKGTQICSCALLRGNPLLQVACAIYTDRPRVCKEFIRGSSSCLAAVRWLEDQVG